jgi:beta-lactam-binding protein with PASTA domain
VIGQSTAQAEAALTAADIDFTTQTQASQLPAGTVVAQAPEAGSYVPPKAVIVLKIAAS